MTSGEITVLQDQLCSVRRSAKEKTERIRDLEERIQLLERKLEQKLAEDPVVIKHYVG